MNMRLGAFSKKSPHTLMMMALLVSEAVSSGLRGDRCVRPPMAHVHNRARSWDLPTRHLEQGPALLSSSPDLPRFEARTAKHSGRLEAGLLGRRPGSDRLGEAQSSTKAS
jgi:hypothetical protein